MEIVYALVRGGRDYRDEAVSKRAERVRSLLDTVRRVVEERPKTSLLAFSAGYLGVHRVTQRDDVIHKIQRDLKQISPPFGVLWGIDVGKFSKHAKKGDVIRSDLGYPYFACYWAPAGTIATFQQISINAKEGRGDDVDRLWEAQGREALLPGTQIALLICGEALSDRLRKRVASAKCHALFIPAHFNVTLRQDHLGRGKGSWHHPLKAFQRENDIPVILSEHTAHQVAMRTRGTQDLAAPVRSKIFRPDLPCER